MQRGLIYIHGKGGSAAEAEHYRKLFPTHDVVGFDYKSETPWEAQTEFSIYYDVFRRSHDEITIVANSIGAYFSMVSLNNKDVKSGYFISPIVNMAQLITDMMKWANVTEKQLEAEGEIETSFGEVLSRDYLSWVRRNPAAPVFPIHILYGSNDHLQSIETIQKFAKENNADVTVMDGGEHWFHTEKQMAFLDRWILDMIKNNR